MSYNITHINVDFKKIILECKCILFVFIILNLVFNTKNLKAQPKPINTACYCIEEGGGQPNTLFKLQNNNWVKEGYIYSLIENLNGKIEAFAAKPKSNLLYVVDLNRFGTIDVNTQIFTGKGYVTGGDPGSGVNGNQIFDDIDAMAYDPYKHEIWAINRNPGYGPGTEDFLIKIDPETGRYVPGAFEGGNDYAVIPSVFDGTFDLDNDNSPGGQVYDVDGIAFNPYTNILYTVQNQEGPGVITSINTINGDVEQVIYDMNEDDIEGLGISTYGQLFGTSGDNGSAESSFIFIDLLNGSTSNLTTIDPTGQYTDFESFDCVLGVFDLALKIELATAPINVKANNNIIFNITIQNQGDVEVDGFVLSAYLPIGVSLNDNNWTAIPNEIQKIKRNVNLKINAGQTKVTTLGLKVSSLPPPDFQLACEISEMFNNTIDEVHNYSVALPDIDSTPDYSNNEKNIQDNIMSQGGPKVNKDEDDHDIVNVEVIIPECETNLNITGSILNGSYSANQTILSNGIVGLSKIVQFRAGSNITLNNGFTANLNSILEIMIDDCN